MSFDLGPWLSPHGLTHPMSMDRSKIIHSSLITFDLMMKTYQDWVVFLSSQLPARWVMCCNYRWSCNRIFASGFISMLCSLVAISQYNETRICRVEWRTALQRGHPLLQKGPLFCSLFVVLFQSGQTNTNIRWPEVGCSNWTGYGHAPNSLQNHCTVQNIFPKHTRSSWRFPNWRPKNHQILITSNKHLFFSLSGERDTHTNNTTPQHYAQQKRMRASKGMRTAQNITTYRTHTGPTLTHAAVTRQGQTPKLLFF